MRDAGKADHTQQNQYNGFGQRVKKQEYLRQLNIFMMGQQSFIRRIRTMRSALQPDRRGGQHPSTARPGEGDAVSFTPTPGSAESTINVVGRTERRRRPAATPTTQRRPSRAKTISTTKSATAEASTTRPPDSTTLNAQALQPGKRHFPDAGHLTAEAGRRRRL